jgi:hypothetical protein
MQSLPRGTREFIAFVIGDIVRWRGQNSQIAGAPRHAVSLIYLLRIEQTRYCLGLADQPELGG